MLDGTTVKSENFTLISADTGVSAEIETTEYYPLRNEIWIFPGFGSCKLGTAYRLSGTGVLNPDGQSISLSKTAYPEMMRETTLYDMSITSFNCIVAGVPVSEFDWLGNCFMEVKAVNSSESEKSVELVITLTSDNGEVSEIYRTVVTLKGNESKAFVYNVEGSGKGKVDAHFEVQKAGGALSNQEG